MQGNLSPDEKVKIAELAMQIVSANQTRGLGRAMLREIPELFTNVHDAIEKKVNS